MSEVYFFQRYHTKENMHSSNALLLLKRVYYYDPKIFYKVISNWVEVDSDEFLPSFITQEKGKKSIPDFCIKQNGFKIVVEAKEKYNSFTEDQMRRHVDNLLSEPVDTRIFIALAPKFNESDCKVFDIIKKHAIKFINLTYLDLYNSVREVCDEYHDSEIIEILEEYKDYCNEENLIDDSDSTIMVRLAGSTLDFNVRPENSIYYDKYEHRYEGFRYLGLYKEKCVKYIGEIEKIIKAYQNKDGKYEFECLIPHGGKISDLEKERVLRAMDNQKALYDNINIPHNYFLVNKFLPVENFIKSSKMALYGRKKFYLQQFNLQPKSSVEDIAEKMKNKTWEEIEGK